MYEFTTSQGTHAAVNPDRVVRLTEIKGGNHFFTMIHTSDGFVFEVRKNLQTVCKEIKVSRNEL